MLITIEWLVPFIDRSETGEPTIPGVALDQGTIKVIAVCSGYGYSEAWL